MKLNYNNKLLSELEKLTFKERAEKIYFNLKRIGAYDTMAWFFEITALGISYIGTYQNISEHIKNIPSTALPGFLATGGFVFAYRIARDRRKTNIEFQENIKYLLNSDPRVMSNFDNLLKKEGLKFKSNSDKIKQHLVYFLSKLDLMATKHSSFLNILKKSISENNLVDTHQSIKKLLPQINKNN